MEFVKYPSIENSYRERPIDAIIRMGKDREEWVATIKVHGANFSMHTDGVDVISASKSEFVGPDGFYNSEGIVDANRDVLVQLLRDLNRYHHDTIRQIGVYGELFGGYYNHPDVPHNPKSTRIMKGISYSPDNHFYMFGMTINGKWVNHDLMVSSSFYLNCLTSYELGRGTLQECLAIPNDTPDPIHKFFGLPEVEGNIIEGVVIEPVYPFLLYNGKRAILKNKNDKWKEKSKPKKPREVPIYPLEVREQIEEICSYVTENRLNNILSHIGELEDKDFGRLIGVYSKDVYEDYLKDNEESYKLLDKQSQSVVRKQGQKDSAKFLKARIREIIK